MLHARWRCVVANGIETVGGDGGGCGGGDTQLSVFGAHERRRRARRSHGKSRRNYVGSENNEVNDRVNYAALRRWRPERRSLMFRHQRRPCAL